MKISPKAYSFVRTLMEDHEVFSARIPFCTDMEQKLALLYSEHKDVVHEALAYLRSHKVYKEFEKQNYPSYDLEGSPCNKIKSVPPTSKQLTNQHRTRTETLNKPLIRIRHTMLCTKTEKRLEAVAFNGS